MIADYRNLLMQIVNKGNNIISSKFLQVVSKQKLILPFYHIISDEDCPHVKHLYAIKNRKAFIDDLDFILKHYRPIDYGEFDQLARNNRLPDKPSFLLSFDDGLKEFYDVIAPILIKKGIPAVCFLNSGFIDNKDFFYRYKASLLIDKIEGNSNLNRSVSALFNNNEDVIQSILSVSYDNKNILDRIAKLVEINFDSFLSNHKPYLTSNQIHSLAEKGFSFGAHSIDHPEYQYLDLDEQIRQTKESMEFISEKFALDYKVFSFPFTDYNVSNDFFTKIHKNKILDYTFACAGQKNDSIFNNFQRIPFEISNYSAETILKTELLYYLLKMPFRKNVINRK